MTEHEVNPFQELYVTDTPDLESFVRLFSDWPVRAAQALFRSGNVVLKGTQGCGKSMLLNLLRPDVRVAYHRAGVSFPVPDELSAFIGAGISLSKSGALDIGTRPTGADPAKDQAMFPMYFSDFVNFLVVRDILESLRTVRNNSDPFGSLVDAARFDEFAVRLAVEDCWFGALAGVSGFRELREKLDVRIVAYRSFHNNYGLPWPVDTTPTTIGEPIARTARCLKHCGVIAESTPVFIRIDQLERLYRSDIIRPSLGKAYRRIINKALGTRDLRVSYRIGTRRYGWEDDRYIFGTGDRLEHLRDYRIIDLDYAIRRQEDRRTWFFPFFMEDVFARRLLQARYISREDTYWSKPPRKRDLIGDVLRGSEHPSEAARRYSRNSIPEKVLRIDAEWPEGWRHFLLRLFADDPLEGVLAAAWAQQRGTSGRAGRRLSQPPPTGDRPWHRAYWRKERVRQSLLQIAARAAQRLEWGGKQDIQSLSGGNISIFLSICHEVWESLLRSERAKEPEQQTHPIRDGIPLAIQATGIHAASRYWYEKIAELPGGDDRRDFLDSLARTFRTWLVDDTSMSYPGHNGFSVAVDDLRHCPRIAQFLEEACAYGDLYDVLHTTKRRDRRQRRKWYLTPILSPCFQLPESHVKEPYYATIGNVVWWVRDARLFVTGVENAPAEKPERGGRGTERHGPRTEHPLFDSDGE